MYYVGIDIAKRSHVAVIMNEDNSLRVKPFSIAPQTLCKCYNSNKIKLLKEEA